MGQTCLQLGKAFIIFCRMLLFVSALLFSQYVQTAFTEEVVEMKIVDNPASYGFGHNSLQSWGAGGEIDERLKMRVQPANVSGPPHLLHLRKRCFSKTFENYKYNFCPFSNVTQHEQGYHWNPYNGVLGVWQEWEVENNTFVSMEMHEGDDCGHIHRSVKVRLVCGNTTEIVNVSEPNTCHYVMVFTTPLVCHPQSLLVYPILSTELRSRWDQLEGQKYRKELTEKGYKKRLQLILEEAGLRLTEKQRKQLSTAVVEHTDQEKEQQDTQCLTLPQCAQNYRQLKQELEELKAELATYKNASNAVSAQNASHTVELGLAGNHYVNNSAAFKKT